MTLLRAAYRTMLASYFIASGVKALRDPDSLVPDAEPLTDRVVPLIKEYAPQQVAGYVPEDAKTLVRVNGATQVVGGLALATGKGRRLGALLLAGSLVPSTIAKHPFWSRSDPDAAGGGPAPVPQERQPARRRAAGLAGHRGQAEHRAGGPRRAARRSPRAPARPPTSWPRRPRR